MRFFRKWFSIQMAKHAHLMILLGIVVFNVALWLIASFVSFLIDRDDFPSYGDALAKSIAWLLDPGTYSSSSPFIIRLLSVIVIVTAMVTFSGGIIAYVASVFSSVIENSKEGRSRLCLHDHIVILNWNSEAPELICEFCSRDKREDIVVLSDDEKESVERQIKNKAFENGKNLHRCNIIVRTGSVFSEANLASIGADRAKTIVILRDESQKITSDDDADILSLKAMMVVLTEKSAPMSEKTTNKQSSSKSRRKKRRKSSKPIEATRTKSFPSSPAN